jgi:hypothetical protein
MKTIFTVPAIPTHRKKTLSTNLPKAQKKRKINKNTLNKWKMDIIRKHLNRHTRLVYHLHKILSMLLQGLRKNIRLHTIRKR